MLVRHQAEWTGRAAAIKAPPRRSDLREERLDGEAIVADPRTGHTHRLNASALAIWDACDGRATTREIAEQLTRSWDLSFDDALDHVDQLVARFAGLRLFETGEQTTIA
jgi:PqqD family protein of HPr-rel-A system